MVYESLKTFKTKILKEWLVKISKILYLLKNVLREKTVSINYILTS